MLSSKQLLELVPTKQRSKLGRDGIVLLERKVPPFFRVASKDCPFRILVEEP